MFLNGRQIKVFRIEEHQRAEQDVRRVRTQLFALPQVFLLDAGHDVLRIIVEHGELFGDLVQTVGEALVVGIGKDVVDSTVLEQILLDAQHQIVDGVRCVFGAVRFSNLLHEQTQRVVELVGRKLKDFRLEWLPPDGALFEIGILCQDPLLPGVYAERVLETHVGVRLLDWLPWRFRRWFANLFALDAFVGGNLLLAVVVVGSR